MSISVGDRIHQATLVKASADGPQPVDSEEFFRGRRVALFSVPGAFTPTCHKNHMPGYVEKAEAFKAKGVDAIYVTSTNDVFVLDAWQKASGAVGKVGIL
ncbi:MAG: redoxin family protein, partial [Allosphingosinicella sp.]